GGSRNNGRPYPASGRAGRFRHALRAGHGRSLRRAHLGTAGRQGGYHRRWPVAGMDRGQLFGAARAAGGAGGPCGRHAALGSGRVRMVRTAASSETRRPGERTLATSCPSGGSLEIFVEPRLPKPLLVVFGDSPAAHTLVALGSLTGFRTCAVHPAARTEDFSGADMVLSGLDLRAAAPGSGSWVVGAPMGHYDEDALEAALAYPALDVGLVASSRRAAAVLDALRRRGLPDSTLARVRTPAGGTHAGSQEEIALAAL